MNIICLFFEHDVFYTKRRLPKRWGAPNGEYIFKVKCNRCLKRGTYKLLWDTTGSYETESWQTKNYKISHWDESAYGGNGGYWNEMNAKNIAQELLSGGL